MSLYAEHLRRIADMCDALSKIDGADQADGTLQLKDGIQVVDEHGDVYGVLRDEVGGAWAFFPRGGDE